MLRSSHFQFFLILKFLEISSQLSGYSFFGIFSQVSLDPWIYSTHVTTDTTSTTTDCNARTAEIFIHQEFNKIAEDI